MGWYGASLGIVAFNNNRNAKDGNKKTLGFLVYRRKGFIEQSLSIEAVSKILKTGKNRMTLAKLLWVNEFLKKYGGFQIKIAQMVYSKGPLTRIARA